MPRYYRGGGRGGGSKKEKEKRLGVGGRRRSYSPREQRTVEKSRKSSSRRYGKKRGVGGRRKSYTPQEQERVEQSRETTLRDIRPDLYGYINNMLSRYGINYTGGMGGRRRYYPEDVIAQYAADVRGRGQRGRSNVIQQERLFPAPGQRAEMRANLQPSNYGTGRYGRGLRMQSYANAPFEKVAYEPWLEGYTQTPGGGGEYAGYGGYPGYGYGGYGGGGSYSAPARYPRQQAQYAPGARYAGGFQPAGNYAQRPVTPRWYQNLITWTI